MSNENNRKWDRYNNGEVILPIEVYNQMLLEASLFKRAIEVRKAWWTDTKIEVVFNPTVLEMVITEMFNELPFAADFRLYPQPWDATTQTIGEIIQAPAEDNE